MTSPVSDSAPRLIGLPSACIAFAPLAPSDSDKCANLAPIWRRQILRQLPDVNLAPYWRCIGASRFVRSIYFR